MDAKISVLWVPGWLMRGQALYLLMITLMPH